MAQEKQDQFWASPTVRSILLGVIAALISVTIYLLQFFISQFNTRMTSVEKEVSATKTVVITLAIKQGVDVDTLTTSASVPMDTTPEEGERMTLMALPAKKMEDLDQVVVQ